MNYQQLAKKLERMMNREVIIDPPDEINPAMVLLYSGKTWHYMIELPRLTQKWIDEHRLN